MRRRAPCLWGRTEAERELWYGASGLEFEGWRGCAPSRLAEEAVGHGRPIGESNSAASSLAGGGTPVLGHAEQHQRSEATRDDTCSQQLVRSMAVGTGGRLLALNQWVEGVLQPACDRFSSNT